MLPSPCTKQCQLDEAQVCTGCRRSIDEIRRWSQASETEKKQIWQRLLALPPRQKQCQRCQATFSCGSGGQNGCWCMDLPVLTAPASGDCYCPACLSSLLKVNNLSL